MKQLISILIILALAGVSFGLDYGPMRITQAATGGTHEDDTLNIPEAYLETSGRDIVGMYLYVSKTTDGLAPLNDACRILAVDWTQSAYNIVLDQEVEAAGNDASLGLSASITAGDYIMIVSVPPSTSELREVVTGAFPSSGTTERQILQYLADSSRFLRAHVTDWDGDLDDLDSTADNIVAKLDPELDAIRTVALQCSTYTGNIDTTADNIRLQVVDIESDADTTELRVQQIHALVDTLAGGTDGAVGTQWSSGAFPVNGSSYEENWRWQSDTLRKIGVNTDSTLFYIHSTTGMPAVTGLFPAAGVSLSEKVQFLADSLRKVGVNTDSVLFYLHSAAGAPAVTGVFPVAGTSIAERIQFLADSLRKVAVNTDSTLFYIHSTTGAPAVTGAFPAAGLSINERIQYLADSLRKVAVTTDTVYSAVLTATGAQWGTATEPANGVNLLEGVGFLQNQVDSIQGALNGDVGNQWGTSALPANGVAVDEVIRQISDAAAGANGFNYWREPVEVIVNFAAAGAWEEAATTHELFNVTGDVEFEISAFCSTTVTVTSADSFFVLNGDAAGASVWRVLGTDMTAGEGLLRGVSAAGLVAVIPTAAQQAGSGGGVWHGTASMGGDIGFDIDDNDFTGGILIFECRWRPRTTGGTVAAGTGGAL